MIILSCYKVIVDTINPIQNSVLCDINITDVFTIFIRETSYENGSISLSSKGWVIRAMVAFLANLTHTIIDWLKKIL